MEVVKRMVDQEQDQQGGFVWEESGLVRALREGEWIVIDNANFASSSVLDRLNCLFEPGGVLALSERGLVGGSVPTVVPHPDFRAFLIYDPQHGEVRVILFVFKQSVQSFFTIQISRAMRNRCVELHIPLVNSCSITSTTLSLGALGSFHRR